MGGEPDEVRWRGVRPVEGIRGVWPERNAARVDKIKLQSSAGGTNFYTVPAGKILFIYQAFLNSRLTVAAATAGWMVIRTGGDVDVFTISYHLYTIEGQMGDNHNYSPAVAIPAGYKVRVYSSSNDLHLYASFHGWLEEE